MLTTEDVLEYLNTLDSAITKLSVTREGCVSRLASWILAPRRITLAHTADGNGVVVRIIPDHDLAHDVTQTRLILSHEDLCEVMRPWTPRFRVSQLATMPYTLWGDVLVVEADNPLAQPALNTPGLITWGRADEVAMAFTIDSANKDAVEMWSAARTGAPSHSFIHEIKRVLGTFRCLIKQKAWKEGRIHHFLRDHAKVLLPQHNQCLYEHRLYLDGEERVADFILRREHSQPPLLIELESTVHRVLRKNGMLTAKATHAVGQITEWIGFIDKDGKRNASGEYSFLAGPKIGLVIIGTGLEHTDRLKDKRFGGTTFWTYHDLLEEAKQRLNNELGEMCRIIGCKEIRPF